MHEDRLSLIDTLNRWLTELPKDAEVLRQALLDPRTGSRARRGSAGALGYLLRKIDLIPDHFAGLGRADDVFVMRVAAAQALEAGLDGLSDAVAIEVLRLADEASLVQTCLGALYPRLWTYVEELANTPFRNRRTEQLLHSGEAQEQFLRELRDELRDYEVALVPAEERRRALSEIKLFLASKLPAPPPVQRLAA